MGTAPNPGWKTTEFWLTLAVDMIAALTTFHVIKITSDQTQTIMGVLGMIVPTIIYAFARGQVKVAALSVTPATALAVTPTASHAPFVPTPVPPSPGT